MKPFQIIDHTADWAIQVNGRNLQQLFTHAANGMNSLLVKAGTAVSPTQTHHVELHALDAESLLVAWLSELAYHAEMEQTIFTQFDWKTVTPNQLQATIHGGPITEMEKHIKAVTYHNLAITQTSHGHQVTIVFDV